MNKSEKLKRENGRTNKISKRAMGNHSAWSQKRPTAQQTKILNQYLLLYPPHRQLGPTCHPAPPAGFLTWDSPARNLLPLFNPHYSLPISSPRRAYLNPLLSSSPLVPEPIAPSGRQFCLLESASVTTVSSSIQPSLQGRSTQIWSVLILVLLRVF
jgi:hypothetical protein